MSILHDLITPPLRAVLTTMGRRRLPTIAGTLALPGLQAPVEVLRDRWGVPHLYAGSEHDVYMAQGYVHAQDRLWQMELNRRTANGRLSEVFGSLALDTDRTALTFGFRRLGQADRTVDPSGNRGLRRRSERIPDVVRVPRPGGVHFARAETSALDDR
jgi:acyl-homoserine lactone acylase PvdQ